MTTMELNLRKENLYDLIKDMDEERLSKLENYIKRLCPSRPKKAAAYPWAPSEGELQSIVAESEAGYKKGLYLEEEEMDKFLNEMK